jgi:hypothetical protein
MWLLLHLNQKVMYPGTRPIEVLQSVYEQNRVLTWNIEQNEQFCFLAMQVFALTGIQSSQ